MPSSAQVFANRLNAMRSTGPRTAGGKLVSSRNAVAFGVWTAAPVIPGECPADWDGHRAGILASLAPAGLLEQTLAERAALVLWRLNRLARYEVMTTAADIEDAVLARPADENQMLEIMTGREHDIDKSLFQTRKELAAARKRLADLRQAALALPVLAARSGGDSIPAPAVVTLLNAVYCHANEYTKAELPSPGSRLLKKLGRSEVTLEAVPWTAGIVHQVLEFYAGFVTGGSAEWLAGQVGAEWAEESYSLARRVKRLRRRLAGLTERWQKAAGWRAADAVMPAAGRDDRIIRYESHLHKLLTSTLHELERLQANRAGKDVPLPIAVDVAVNVDGGAG